MNQRFPFLLIGLVAVLVCSIATFAARPRPVISEDRELKEVDLAGWDCRDLSEGSAKTPDGVERNKFKNRPWVDPSGRQFPQLDTRSFLQKMTAFDAQTKGMHRKDLNQTQRQQLEALEQQLVSFTGYLVLAYAGPPETTNCGSSDFHDWHLELFEQPLDHAPQVGDPTPIICEITPRTQSAIYRAGIRIQALAGFIRAPDLTIEPTGHAARKVRIPGYLLWDDEHNGAADIGTEIRTVAANGYHQPWRTTAWEIHPAIKLEALDASQVPPVIAATAAPVSPAASIHPSASPPAVAPRSSPPPAEPQFATIQTAVKIKILYGETVIPVGAKLRVISRNAQTVTVSYLDGTYSIPVTSTDLQ